MQPDSKGFPNRLRRAIDRWPGGGQKAFAEELRQHAERAGIDIPASYRTLANYLVGDTRPSEAWVEAAAAVLRWNPDNLLTGEGPERLDVSGRLDGLSFTAQHAFQARTSALVQYFNRYQHELPMGARQMLLHFLDDYFGDDPSGWGDEDGTMTLRRAHVTRIEKVLRTHFAQLLERPAMGDLETMALTASLTAAAYLSLAAASKKGGTHA